MPTKREMLQTLDDLYHQLGELLGYEPPDADEEEEPEGDEETL